MYLDTDRARGILAAEELDALVATTPPNFWYATAYERTLPFMTNSSVAAVVAGTPPQVRAVVLPRIEAPAFAEYIERHPADPPALFLYGGFRFRFASRDVLGERDARVAAQLKAAVEAPPFVEALSAAITELGLAGTRIGWDDLNVIADFETQRRRQLNRDARGAWRRLRRTKSGPEVALLQQSAAITERIESELIALCAEGAEWTDLYRHYRRATVDAGGVPGFWSSGAGRNAAVIVDSSPGRLARGDLVRFDFGCTYHHYWSDTGRTVSLGEPDTLTRKRHGALRTGLEAGLESLRPGVRPSAVFDVVMSAIHAAGFPGYERHHVGHSIGIEMYDADFVAPGHDQPIEQGMVLNIEVPYYEIGWGGLQIEDTAVVTADGCELLTNLNRDIVVVKEWM